MDHTALDYGMESTAPNFGVVIDETRQLGVIPNRDDIRRCGIPVCRRIVLHTRRAARSLCDIVVRLLANKRTCCDELQKHVDHWDCYGCAGSLGRQGHFRAGQVHPASAWWASVL